MSLSGKVAAVTGGGSGIGEATCARLAADGAQVAVLAELAVGEGVTTALDATARMTDEEWRRILSIHLDGTSDPLIGAVKMGTPQGRLGRPKEIAATISFPCSDDASFVAGETVRPNGGFVTV